MAPLDVCWIDHQYDRENADPGGGRFAAHVAANANEFDDCWHDIAPVRFACAAWRLATAPRLDPGYVRLHRRVLLVECVRNGWDGSLLARARLVSS